MPISSQALGKTSEGSETKDTTVSLQRPTSQVDDDIVLSSWKHEAQMEAIPHISTNVEPLLSNGSIFIKSN